MKLRSSLIPYVLPGHNSNLPASLPLIGVEYAIFMVIVGKTSVIAFAIPNQILGLLEGSSIKN